MQQHHERPAGHGCAGVSKPAEPRELDGGAEEPFDPVQPRRDDHGAARVPRPDQRHVDCQLATVRASTGQRMAFQGRRRRAGRLAETPAGSLVAPGERIEHGGVSYSGIRANVQIEPPAGTRPRA